MSRQRWWFGCAVACATLVGAPSAPADVVIGDWESGTAEGWIDWSNNQTSLPGTRFTFNSTGATRGTTAAQFTLPATGYTQWAAIKLQQGSNGVAEWRDDFLASAKLAVDITLVRSEMETNPGNNFANISVSVNAQGYGFTSQGNPETVTPFVGYNSGNSFNPQLLVGTQTTTWVWDILDTHDGAAPDIVQPNPDYIELVFETYSNGPVVYHIDNVRLIPVPEPGGIGLGLAGLAGLALRRRRP